jgi:nucleoid-associated protein YgaU
LLSGLVLAVLALIWVATRPSLSTHARMQGPSAATSRQERQPELSEPAPTEATPTTPAESTAQPADTLPPGLILPEPQTSQGPLGEAGRTETSDSVHAEQEEKITTTRFHIVRRGENLSAISQQYYGSPNRWQKILEANKDTLKDPDKIAPGMKLIIPD